jgi:hypothetical protein
MWHEFDNHREGTWFRLELVRVVTNLTFFNSFSFSPEALVRFQTNLCRICDEQSGTGTGFSPRTSVVFWCDHSVNGPYSNFIHLPPALYNVTNWVFLEMQQLPSVFLRLIPKPNTFCFCTLRLSLFLSEIQSATNLDMSIYIRMTSERFVPPPRGAPLLNVSEFSRIAVYMIQLLLRLQW